MKNRKNMSILALILILSGTALGAYIQINYRDGADGKRDNIERISKENKILNDSIEAISKRNEVLNSTISTATAQNHKLIGKNIELADKNQKLAQLNLDLSKITASISKEISQQNTEGESFPDFRIYTLIHDGKPIVLIGIVNHGDNPLFNVSVNYFNPDELPKYGDVVGGSSLATTEDLGARYNEYAEQIKSGGMHQLKNIYYREYFESTKLKTFRFQISTRTKIFYATLQIRFVNGAFQIAKEVKEIENSKGKVIEKIKVLGVPVKEIDPGLVGISEIK